MGCCCGNSGAKNLPIGVSPEVPYLQTSSFKKLEVVGKTGWATIWKMRNKRKGTLVACKIISKTSHRFQWDKHHVKEVNMLHKLADVEGVVNLLGVSSPPEEFWTVVELGAGGTMSKWLKRYPETAVSIAQELADIVHRLHSIPVCHADLKPCNVVLTEDGHVRLIDFEFAQELKPGQKVARSGIGTEGFQGPELFGEGSYCPLKADVFALGRTLQIVADAKPDWHDLTKLIEKMTAEDPESRPAMDEVVAALRRSSHTSEAIFLGCRPSSCTQELQMDNRLDKKSKADGQDDSVLCPLLNSSPDKGEAADFKEKTSFSQESTDLPFASEGVEETPYVDARSIAEI